MLSTTTCRNLFKGDICRLFLYELTWIKDRFMLLKYYLLFSLSVLLVQDVVMNVYSTTNTTVDKIYFNSVESE